MSGNLAGSPLALRCVCRKPGWGCGNKPQEGGVWYGPELQGGRHVFTVSLADLYVPGSCKQTVIK